jgi:hypothetical protein
LTVYPRSSSEPTVIRLIGIGMPDDSAKPVISSALKVSSSQCAPAVPLPPSCSIGTEAADRLPASARYSARPWTPM